MLCVNLNLNDITWWDTTQKNASRVTKREVLQ